MSVMPGPFPPMPSPPPAQPPTAEAIKEAAKQAKRKRDIAVGAEFLGLVILAFGLGMWQHWLGVTVFGFGIILIGIGTELS